MRPPLNTPVPVSYAVQGEKSSPRFASAFAAGCGGIATPSEHLYPGPVALFGSPARWEMLQQAILEGRTWIYGDHGYFNKSRHTFFRITKNAYQHSGVGEGPAANPTRLRNLRVTLNPSWNTGGSAIIVCPNSPTYMNFFGIDAHQWVLEVVKRLGEVSDRPIIVRWKAQAQRRPLYVDLHDGYLCVVFSSASAVEALCAGVPVCTLAPWASTASMGITSLDDVETPVYPPMKERDRFLAVLANQQWNLDEIRKGDAWKVLSQEQA